MLNGSKREFSLVIKTLTAKQYQQI